MNIFTIFFLVFALKKNTISFRFRSKKKKKQTFLKKIKINNTYEHPRILLSKHQVLIHDIKNTILNNLNNSMNEKYITLSNDRKSYNSCEI